MARIKHYNSTTQKWEYADASVGLKGTDGKTPVKGVDYFTEADKAEIVRLVHESIGTPIFGVIEDDNTVILSGNISESNNLTIKYRMKNGSLVDIGNLSFVEDEPGIVINLLDTAYDTDLQTVYNGIGYKEGVRVSNGGGGSETSGTKVILTGLIPLGDSGDVFHVRGVTHVAYVDGSNAGYVSCWTADGAYIADSRKTHNAYSSVVGTDENGDFTITIPHDKLPSGTAYLRFELGQITGEVIMTRNQLISKNESATSGNLADPTSSDWVINKRVNSSGGLTDKEGMLTTNYIPAKAGDVLRVKGINLFTVLSGDYAKVSCFDSTKSYLNFRYTAVNAASSGEGAKEAVTVENDVYTYTILLHGDGTQAAKATTSYIRISGALMDGYTENDVIITINEEITEEDKPVAGYTNLADPTSADWVEDHRLSISSGTPSACEGQLVTNFIPAKMGDVLRVKGLSIVGKVNNENLAIGRYNSNKTKQGGGYGSTAASDNNYGLKVTTNGDVSTYTIALNNNGGQVADSATAYIRLGCAYLSGYDKNNVIITINEPIEGDSSDVETPTYTNLFDPSAAIINQRVNSSSVLTSAPGHFVTASIDVSDKVPFTDATKIYVKGANFNNTSTGNNYTRIFTFANTNTDYTNSYSAGNGNNLSITDEGNGVISVSNLKSSFPSQIKRMVFVLRVKDSDITADDIKDVVITIDEPIS